MSAKRILSTAALRAELRVVPRIWQSWELATLLKDRVTCAAALFLTVTAFCAVLAPIVAPYDPLNQVLTSRLLVPASFSPAGFHLLGTDELGRDILSRLIHGSRITLAVAAGAVLVSAMAGAVMGLIAGYSGGWIDNVLMRIVDLTMAFPLLLLALVLLYVFGPSMQNVIIVLGVIRWPLFARLARVRTLIRQEEYIPAAL